MINPAPPLTPEKQGVNLDRKGVPRHPAQQTAEPAEGGDQQGGSTDPNE